MSMRKEYTSERDYTEKEIYRQVREQYCKNKRETNQGTKRTENIKVKRGKLPREPSRGGEADQHRRVY